MTRRLERAPLLSWRAGAALPFQQRHPRATFDAHGFQATVVIIAVVVLKENLAVEDFRGALASCKIRRAAS